MCVVPMEDASSCMRPRREYQLQYGDATISERVEPNVVSSTPAGQLITGLNINVADESSATW